MNYMTDHLLEAIALNCRRLPKYARLTRGRSIPVSLLLILSEGLSLITAYAMDVRAKYWRKRGVPVFKHEYISMKLVPEFKASFSFKPKKLGKLPKVDLDKKMMKALINERSFSELSLLISKEIEKLQEYPHAFCMLRHTLESFLRCSNLTPLHIERASELGVKSPEGFCVANLKSHLLALDFCVLLDKTAVSLQDEGVPIICQDVPPIPPTPESY